MTHDEDIRKLADEIRANRNVLIALGDEMRQHLILTMLSDCRSGGMRVNDLAARMNLSRPAVSHHLQILKNAGIMKMRREGTKNYYSFDSDTEAMDGLIRMLEHARGAMRALPEGGGIGED